MKYEKRLDLIMKYKNSESLWMQSRIDYILLTASFNIEKYTLNYLQVWKKYDTFKREKTEQKQHRIGLVRYHLDDCAFLQFASSKLTSYRLRHRHKMFTRGGHAIVGVFISVTEKTCKSQVHDNVQIIPLKSVQFSIIKCIRLNLG